MRGEQVGSYRLDRKLGEGGMGVVYEAAHTVLGKLAAVKMMRPQLCADAESVARFFNEAVLTANIRHPGIVEIFDYGVHESTGSAFITMELLEGESLETRLDRERRLTVVDSLRIARQIASALAAAHDAGVIHRDLKPDNVFLTADPDLPGGERIQLLDFGIAKLLDPEKQATNLTQTGTMIGTPLYMSPEQCRGHSGIDGRTDLYALGCMLYRMLAGQPPFTGSSPLEVAAAHMRDQPEPLGDRLDGLPQPVSDLVDQLLAKSPEGRPASAAVLHRQLGKLLATVDTVKGFADRAAPADEAEERARLDEVIGSAATIATGAEEREPVRSRRRIAVALAALASAAIIGLAISRAVAGDEVELSVTHELPQDCAELGPEPCRRAAWELAAGAFGRIDRDAAAALFRDACERGSFDGCKDAIAVDRRMLLRRVLPHFGDPGAGVAAHLIVDFADPSLREKAAVAWEKIRVRFPGEVSLALLPAARDNTESLRAARAACAVHRQRRFDQYLFVHSFAGGYGWSIERLADLNWPGVDHKRLVDDFNGACVREVEVDQFRAEILRIKINTLFIAGYEVPPPHEMDLAAYFLDRHIARSTERESRTLEQQRRIQSLVRYPIEAVGPPSPITVIGTCDPSRYRCDVVRAVADSQAQVFGARLNNWIIAVDPERDLAARTLCATDKLGIAEPMLEHLAELLKTKSPPDDRGVRQVVEAAGGKFAELAVLRDGICAREVEGATERLRAAGAPLEVNMFVNGRPALIMGTPSHALIREELTLADLVGYDRRIPAVEYYDWVIAQ